MKNLLIIAIAVIIIVMFVFNKDEQKAQITTNNIVNHMSIPKVELKVDKEEIFDIKMYEGLKGDITLRKNIVIIFDDSGSMQGSKINRAKTATISLLKSLRSQYNVAIYGLNSALIMPLIPIEKGIEKYIQDIKNIKEGGTTPITNALKVAIEILKKQKKFQSNYGSYTIVVVTDGKADDFQGMFTMVNKAIYNGININTIGLDIGEHGLREVTKFVEASSSEELITALKQAVKAELSEDIQFTVQDF